MEPIKGEVVTELPELRHVRDLDQFELILLSLYESKDGEPWLEDWCDCDKSKRIHRWLVYRTTRGQLARYDNGDITRNYLVRYCPDGFVYAVDRDGGGEIVSALKLAVSDLPEDYL